MNDTPTLPSPDDRISPTTMLLHHVITYHVIPRDATDKCCTRLSGAKHVFSGAQRRPQSSFLVKPHCLLQNFVAKLKKLRLVTRT